MHEAYVLTSESGTEFVSLAGRSTFRVRYTAIFSFRFLAFLLLSTEGRQLRTLGPAVVPAASPSQDASTESAAKISRRTWIWRHFLILVLYVIRDGIITSRVSSTPVLCSKIKVNENAAV